jgi:hypothetical protein
MFARERAFFVGAWAFRIKPETTPTTPLPQNFRRRSTMFG